MNDHLIEYHRHGLHTDDPICKRLALGSSQLTCGVPQAREGDGLGSLLQLQGKFPLLVCYSTNGTVGDTDMGYGFTGTCIDDLTAERPKAVGIDRQAKENQP